MIQLIIIALITFLLVFLFHRFLIECFRKIKYWNNAFEKALIAVFTIVSVFSVDSTLSFLFEPRFSIETNKKQKSCTIKIKIEVSYLWISSANIEEFFIEYPVIGTITDFADMNPVTKAQSHAFVLGGNDPTTLTNHLQLQVYDIAPKASLDYTFFWMPPNTGCTVEFEGFDKYEIRYTWKYKGKEISKTQWRQIEDDKIAKPPRCRIVGGQFSFGKPLPPPKPIPKRKLE